MIRYADISTGFTLNDPSEVPLSESLPSFEEVQAAYRPLILSASGWRKVFTPSGEEDDQDRDIGEPNQVIAAHMAAVFATWLRSKHSRLSRVIVGYDTRPTGPSLADVMNRVFLAMGLELEFLGTSAAPEIMAYARNRGAFAYISASHNPVGHNGIKFGLDNGGVLDGGDASELISDFRKAILSPDAAETARALIRGCPLEGYRRVLEAREECKTRALAVYGDFTRLVVSDEDSEVARAAFFKEIGDSARELAKAGAPLSLVVDFNGSARAASIDRSFIESLGMSLLGMNGTPGAIAHRIVPEGASLDFCAAEIERLRATGTTAEQKNALIGYVPDCDGDRGNIVYWNEKTGRAQALEAQEVFALAAVAELAHLEYRDPGALANSAVVVNDPTSLRIEEVARAFGAVTARAEVGEANVVNLARSLRCEGKIVRILGEGSNGGNITHPAAVRDPLNTVFAILKLLLIRDKPGKEGLFHRWCLRSGQGKRYRDAFTLADVLETLPSYVTTSVYEKDAMLGIKTQDHGQLKSAFQRVFEREWISRSAWLKETMGIASWEALSYNGTKESRGIADFGSSGKGGLKVQFLDGEGIPLGYIWMRGSGTEPVFRILADVKGSDPRREKELLSWLTAMVLEADA